MVIPRGLCACGATIVMPLATDRETLAFFIRAHNDSERHMAWSRARIDPSFELATGYVGGDLDGATDTPWTATRASGRVLFTPVPPAALEAGIGM